MKKKGVGDLGVAAYMLMHGYKVSGRQNRMLYFEFENEIKFDNLKLEYLSSEFHRFDSCLMSLKKLDEATNQINTSKFVTDLGAAAFLLMNKFKLLGRKGKTIYFEVNNKEESDQFDEYSLDYLNSDFHRFDSCLMSLKKVGEST